jgi:hypothetical protein
MVIVSEVKALPSPISPVVTSRRHHLYDEVPVLQGLGRQRDQMSWNCAMKLLIGAACSASLWRSTLAQEEYGVDVVSLGSANATYARGRFVACSSGSEGLLGASSARL